MTIGRKMASYGTQDTGGGSFFETYRAQFSEHHLLDTEEDDCNDCNMVIPAVVYEDPDGTSDENASQDSADDKSTPSKLTKTARELRKQLKNAGKEFVNAAGKLVPAKIFVDKPCGCKQGCATVISSERREKLFTDYYNISWEEKTAFIKQHIQLKNVNRRYSKDKSSHFRRTYSRIYRLPDERGNLRIVCKQFFIDTLAVSCKRVNGALLRNVVFGEIEPDRRGKQKRIKQEDERLAYEFIAIQPTYELDGLKYLTNETSVMAMHKHYKEMCDRSEKLPVSIFYFRKLFSTQFQLHFRPRSKSKLTVQEHS